MAGYTTITVKGQEIGLRFGLRAIKRISLKLKEIIADKSLDEGDQAILILRDRVYSGYLCDCMYRDVQPTIPVEDFTEYVENAALAKNTEELITVYKVYEESVAALPKVEAPEDEKKSDPEDEEIDWDETEIFCEGRNRDFNRITWREFILLRRAHDRERVEQLEDVRLISYCAIYQFLEKGTTIEKFLPLPTDKKRDSTERDQKTRELMNRIREAHKKKYNIP